MLLYELLRSADIFYRAEGDEQVNITTISSDSRTAAEGSLFVCIRGRTHNGHSYVKEAIAHGARAILAEDELDTLPCGVTVIYTPDTTAALSKLWSAWYHHPERELKLIAITGTNGKTTTAFMLDAIFSAAFCRCGVIGTVCCKTPKRILDSEVREGATGMTTPEPEVLYRALEAMRRDGAEYVFIEVTSHALSLGRVEPLYFEAAIFTNLTAEHLDFHRTMENYFLAKASLLEKCRVAFINLDDGYAERYRAYARATGGRARILLYSALGKSEADYKALNVRSLGCDGSSYRLSSKNAVREIRTRLPGGFNVDNTLAAASVALELGINGRVVSDALFGFKGAPGRFIRIRMPKGYVAAVYIDYAHTPDALTKLITGARALLTANGRLWTLFGCGGDRDREKRPVMGRIASVLSDVCILTSDNSRSELPEDIISDIVSGVEESACCVVIPSRESAIEYAIDNARLGDIILLCGKGHEKYEVGLGGKRFFDEEVIAQNAALSRVFREMNSAEDDRYSKDKKDES